ncbi:MAG: hypothetical protein M3N82_01940 [Pseudomonadota bacterium]|nr:hypothetical protein [Pseudomonadota bacterium]
MAANFLNATQSQHYLSQAEQRLNTSTPQAASKNQRIYEFDVIGRFHDAKLGQPRNPRIRANLALDDVFSFDVKKNSTLRQNFEALFHAYEDNIVAHSEAVLQKAAANDNDGMNVEVFELFKAKLLNFMRNPHSVPKMLDTFRQITMVVPTDPDRRAQLDEVLNGNRPHEETTCKVLGLTRDQYTVWLGTQFMLLSDVATDQDSLFDQIVNSLFTNPAVVVLVWIGKYTEHRCMLSDRAATSSINLPGVDCIEFNLRHDAFIRYVFRHRNMFRPELTQQQIDAMPKVFNVYYSVDDMEHLRAFNQNVINQSHSRVFCSTDKGLVF